MSLERRSANTYLFRTKKLCYNYSNLSFSDPGGQCSRQTGSDAWLAGPLHPSRTEPSMRLWLRF